MKIKSDVPAVPNMKYSHFRCAEQCAALCFSARHKARNIVVGTPGTAVFNLYSLLRQHCRIALGERNDTFDRSLCGCQKYLCVTSGRSNKTKASLFRKENCLSKKEVSAALSVRATFIITTADLLQKMLTRTGFPTTSQLSARM